LARAEHAGVSFSRSAPSRTTTRTHPGGKPRGGRSLECPMFSYKELGAWAERVSVGEFYPEVITTMGETPLGQPVPSAIPAAELQRRRANDERGCGQALIGRLLKACLERGVEIHTGARATELRLENGVVVGVRIETAREAFDAHAEAGVVLATGGFEWNDALATAFLRGPMTGRVSPQTNTGDGLVMAMKAGAALSNMREAWWLPVARVRARQLATHDSHHLRANLPRLDHGQPRGQALHQRGGELQRVRRRLPARPGPALEPIDPALHAHLRRGGYVGLSVYGKRVAAEIVPGVALVNTHVDPVDWRGTGGYLGDEVMLERLIGSSIWTSRSAFSAIISRWTRPAGRFSTVCLPSWRVIPQPASARHPI
ncbi:MAG: FAD-binding protein, partial [Sphingomonadales bacterium]|nr:FAD-binding protein [Sphingomonadales bacterium]